jgi:hypothetical protein
MININYPKILLMILKRKKHKFIPKKTPYKQKYLKLHHTYYCEDFAPESYFKVLEFLTIENKYYAILLFSNNRYWLVPNDISNINNIYELIYDKNNLLQENIINSNKSYFGYEIIYWFYNKYNNKYNGFKQYIEDDGKSRLNDNYKYFINAKYKNNKYINITITLDDKG